jgi:methyl-accepting chemotaxis protein
MDVTATKHLSDALRQLNTHIKRCRAADQILQGYVRLNSSSEGVARALGELQSAADELARHARQFTKAVTDLAATVTNAPPVRKEASPSA